MYVFVFVSMLTSSAIDNKFGAYRKPVKEMLKYLSLYHINRLKSLTFARLAACIAMVR